MLFQRNSIKALYVDFRKHSSTSTHKKIFFLCTKGGQEIVCHRSKQTIRDTCRGEGMPHEGIPSYVHFGSQHMFVNHFMCICRSALWISSVKTWHTIWTPDENHIALTNHSKFKLNLIFVLFFQPQISSPLHPLSLHNWKNVTGIVVSFLMCTWMIRTWVLNFLVALTTWIMCCKHERDLNVVHVENQLIWDIE